MKEPDLSRYSKGQLTAMLYSYRTIAREHLEAGHWALAKWATRMNTLITIRIAQLEEDERRLAEVQLELADEY